MPRPPPPLLIDPPRRRTGRGPSETSTCMSTTSSSGAKETGSLRRSPIPWTTRTRVPRCGGGVAANRASSSWGMTYSFEVQPTARGRKAARVTTLTHAPRMCVRETNRRGRSIRRCCSGSVPARKPPSARAGPRGEAGVATQRRSVCGNVGRSERRGADGGGPGDQSAGGGGGHPGGGARFAAGDRAPDGRTLALVVEGGALRAVCSAGGVVALEHLGLTEVFDHVYGTSAGAMNASYFITGQARLGIRIYYEDMNRRAVVNPWRFWRILDLDRLFERRSWAPSGCASTPSWRRARSCTSRRWRRRQATDASSTRRPWVARPSCCRSCGRRPRRPSFTISR